MGGESKRRTVDVVLAGRKFRVTTTASEEELDRLVERVESRLREVAGGRAATPEALLLTALALAHDVDREVGRADRVTDDCRRSLELLVGHVDEALGADGGGEGQE